MFPVDDIREEAVRLFTSIDLIAEDREEIETGRPACIAAPFGQSWKGIRAIGSEDLNTGKQQGAVGGHHHGWLTRNSPWVAPLRLPHTKRVLHLAGIDVDL